MPRAMDPLGDPGGTSPARPGEEIIHRGGSTSSAATMTTNPSSSRPRRESSPIAEAAETSSPTVGGTTTTTQDSKEESTSRDPNAMLAVSPAASSTTAWTARDFKESPLYKLSVDFLKTYKSINEVYFSMRKKRQEAMAAAAALQQQQQQAVQGSARAPSPSILAAAAASAQPSVDDEHSDYRIVPGERIGNRYVVYSRIGKGSFGQVVRAYDEVKKQDVAIKIIKAKRPFTRQAQIEIALLTELNTKDADDTAGIVRLLDTFEHHKHQCLVFELLSLNLFEILRNSNYKGVSLELIRKFGQQLLVSLKFLSQPGIDLIHCDLKPENILLRNTKRSWIKIIDFGSSCKLSSKMYLYIQSRFYRAPEIILGLEYTAAIDMWSLGCILYEMHTGEPLFNGGNETEQMHLMVASRGMPPAHMLQDGSNTHKYFEKEEGAWRLKPLSSSSSSAGSRMMVTNHPATLEQALGLTPEMSGPYQRRANEPGHTREHYAEFVQLLESMLRYDPAKRATPQEALNSPFIQRLTALDPNRSGSAASSSSSSNNNNNNVGAPAQPQQEATNSGSAKQEPRTNPNVLGVPTTSLGGPPLRSKTGSRRRPDSR